ncbi:FAD-binding oxidoreductase [Spiractinospora alimapuensis]|uniref:NAD(P)/FAD-dependent oxidoreductase n=1 Tax=Spiractinospora alimapuensis TaxID=2820884 RepID=UPI001F248111|nr:FAD-binding oxidoreductase [Spiractinospora alimapuensis]QVQ51195.1 FAD-binding oxidoreductase [Spiractinospora alimapuensis]
MSDTRGTTDVIIIGGGIVGAGAAYELSRRGVDVTLIERDRVGAHQSGQNWGFVRQQGRDEAELPLMRAANQRWTRLAEELDAPIGWTRGGNLALADTAALARQYLSWVPVGRRHGVDSRLVDVEEVRRIVPCLELDFSAAIYAASDGHADPEATTRAYAEAARRYGTRVLTGHTVRAIRRSGDRVTGVVTESAELSAGTVVCAAGSASRTLLQPVGVDLPQSVVRSTVALSSPVPPVTEATVWATGLAFRQRRDGRLVFSTGGGGEVDVTVETLRQAHLYLPALRKNIRRVQPRVGRVMVTDLRDRLRGVAHRPAHPRPTVSRVHASMRRLRAALPTHARALRVERAWAGLIDSTPDALPVIDRIHVPEGLVIAAGFSGHGFGLAPTVADIVADLVTRSTPAFTTAPFQLDRFAKGRFTVPDAIL